MTLLRFKMPDNTRASGKRNSMNCRTAIRPGMSRLPMLPVLLAGLLLLGIFVIPDQFSVLSTQQVPTIESADAAFAQQNWKDALRQYRKLLSDAGMQEELAARCLTQAEQCLRRLGDQSTIDTVLRTALKQHADKPTVLDAAAGIYLRCNSYGTVAGGKFVRGYARGYGGRGGWVGSGVNVADQDRSQAVALRRRAIELLEARDVSPEQLAAMQLSLGKTLLYGRDGAYAWRLQELTSLDPPNYAELDASPVATPNSPPADDSGERPYLYDIPDSWAASVSDGQRIRFCFAQAGNVDDYRDRADLVWANHLSTTFSVASIREYSWMLQNASSSEQLEGRIQVHTLADNETIAKLATGIKRFELDDDYCHIRLWQRIAQQDNSSATRRSAMLQLTQAFLNRRQYEKAAQQIEKEIEVFGDDSRKSRRELVDSIRQPRLKFDYTPKLLAGDPIQLSVVSRNADSLRFTATQIDLERLLTTWKSYHRLLERGNGKLPNEREPALELIVQSRIQPNDPSRLFRTRIVKEFLTESTVSWEQNIKQRPHHWDRRDEVAGPELAPGAYLVDVTAGDESLARTVVWVEDTALVQTRVKGGSTLMASDLETGAPVSSANVEYFGYGNKRQRQRAYTTSNFARRTDATGTATVQLDRELNWVTLVRREKEDGQRSITILGAQRYWQGHSRNNLQQYKAYAVSDRPIYKPGEKVKVKLWLARSGYGDLDPSALADSSVVVQVIDPKGTAMQKYDLRTDASGGTDFEVDLSSEATLGRYYLAVTANNGQRRVGLASNFQFRVEEYRKPEFEVTIDAPTKPAALGETIQASVQAKYYFGAPVAGGKAVIRIERSAYQEDFYPVMPYDWFYGNGYWWTGGEWNWHPTIDLWRGCMPAPGPTPRRFAPAELVSEKTVTLDENGKAQIEIDSADAKAFQPDIDHQYRVTVNVTDASRRVQTATGEIIAARTPFKVYAWGNKGYYRAGEKIGLDFQARQLSGAPVQAAGTLELFRLSFEPSDDGEPKVKERSVFTIDAATDAEGRFQYEGLLAEGGQYRAELRLRDGQNQVVSGGHIFTVRGNATASSDSFRYSALELTPDKNEYAPGETVNLLVASDYAGARVALFVRPSGGVYPEVKWIELDGKSTVVPIKIDSGDMPNFFVEAVTVHSGQVHKSTRQVFVPPAQQLLNTTVVLDKEEYQPGEEATAQIQVTDDLGRPVAGTSVLAVYDRSLEALASDVLPEDIKIAFWKLLRHHASSMTDSRRQLLYAISMQGVAQWRSLGVFGWSTADDQSSGPGGDIMEMAFGGAPAALASDAFAAGASQSAMAPAGMGGGGFGAKMARSSGRGQTAQPPVQVRKNFADAAVWVANVQLDQSGKASYTFTMPENLTSWRVKSWTMDADVRVGSGETTATTSKPLSVRLAAPRFLVENDIATVAAIVRNDFDSAQSITLDLQIDGETQLRRIDPSQSVIEVPANGESRVQWNVQAIAAGEVTLTVRAAGSLGSDGTQLKLPINVYGALKTDAFVGTIRGKQNESTVKIHVPTDRKVEQSRLVVKVSPSLAMAMVDSLPYLIEFPYGCTEQTLNRFLPAIITQRTLKQLNVDLASVEAHRSNLNTQRITDGRSPTEAARNPVFDEDRLAEVVDEGLKKLTNMQLNDGGWGWFSGGQERSSLHTTATALRGLVVAQQNGVAVVPDTITRGMAWIERHCQQRVQQITRESAPGRANNADALALYTLSVGKKRSPELQRLVFDGRENLSVYGKVLLALTALETNNQQQLSVLRKNIEQYLVQDAENETAFLKGPAPYWYWYGSNIEANAMYLKLLARVAPRSAKASRVVKFLLNNRRNATYWNSTRATALAVEAMADFIAATGEGSEPTTVTVHLGEKRLGEVQFTGDNLFTTENTLVFEADAVPSGQHEITIKRTGNSNLYYSVYLTNFTQQEQIAASGLELEIERKYYKLVPQVRDVDAPDGSGRATSVEQRQLKRVPIKVGEELPSGTMIEVELLVQSKNDYEYIMIRDNKPAGLEVTASNSGYAYSGGLMLYKELRNDHVAMFCSRLPQGNYSLRYQLRTETPGKFSAPPASVKCMYADELRGTSSNRAISIAR